MFVELSKDLHLNLGLAKTVKIDRDPRGLSVCVTYLEGSKTVYAGDNARAIVMALCGQKCRVCGCTEDDCRECIDATGEPCHWVEFDLCSRCEIKPVKPASPQEKSPGRGKGRSLPRAPR